jgi:hypothetical protein
MVRFYPILPLLKIFINNKGKILKTQTPSLDLRLKKNGIIISILTGDITKQKADILLNSIPIHDTFDINKDCLNSQVVSAAGDQFKKVKTNAFFEYKILRAII